MSSKIPEGRERLIELAYQIDGNKIAKAEIGDHIRQIVKKYLFRKPRGKAKPQTSGRARYMTPTLAEEVRAYQFQHPKKTPEAIAEHFGTHPDKTKAALENRV